ncbi:MAG: hypothetical protein NC420_10405 [Eubacterium sp.]|nr:hypothetical protein [Eubacterium sp.]MCM1214367.1 hypothetical protein [Lachnospiraceae bacterium]MCM1305312.1 hypothetical protein [Butyrivibrio sp.]MCM1345222.1 hypothetical protein [Muribaculaceae bacterium]MCM1238659.1 hypothetical protein [Lachnospiraceae bacterium]
MSEERMEDLYDPEALKRGYGKMEHGKAKAAAMRTAIEAADAHDDTSFRIFFRLDLCEESCFYGDSLDMMVIFPEVLAIVDRYPDAPSTCFDKNYKNEMDHVLWVYKWIISNCKDFYQIPMSDCRKFFEDFKRRSQACGYNLRPYYYFLYDFYEKIDPEKAKEAFYAFEKLPRDGNCDCKACERNTVIEFWLQNGEPEKAAELAEDIENFTLRCGHDRMASWLRLKNNYMKYHLRRREFEEAGKYCRILERQTLQDTEFQCWDLFLYCNAYRGMMGRALRVYKAHWKDWQEERDPSEIYDNSIYIALFFRKMMEERESDTIMLSLDASFPLYQESGEYRVEDLYQYYYHRAEDMAEKFDRRNGTTHYHDELVEKLPPL